MKRLTILTWGITIVTIFLWIPTIVSIILQLDFVVQMINSATSIGVIGRADGPTSIFIATVHEQGIVMQSIEWIARITLTIATIILWKKKKSLLNI